MTDLNKEEALSDYYNTQVILLEETDRYASIMTLTETGFSKTYIPINELDGILSWYMNKE